MSSQLLVYPSRGAVSPSKTGSEDAPLFILPSHYLHGSKALPSGLLPVRYAFTVGTRMVRLSARLTNLRFYVGGPDVTVSNSTSHWLPKGGQITFSLRDTDTHIASVRAHLSPGDGVLEISEFTFL